MTRCTCRHDRRLHRQGQGRCTVAACPCLFAPTPAAERATAEVDTAAFNALTEGISQAQIVCCFRVPGEPARKMRPQFNMRQGRAFTPAATAAAERRIQEFLKVVSPNIKPCADYVGLRARFYLAGTGRLDADNAIKLLLDSMQPHVFLNDRQVRKIDAELIDNSREPRTDVLIYRLVETLL